MYINDLVGRDLWPGWQAGHALPKIISRYMVAVNAIDNAVSETFLRLA